MLKGFFASYGKVIKYNVKKDFEEEVNMTVVGKDVLDALSQPFKDDEIEWRAQMFSNYGGNVSVLVLPYIEARAAMKRLDDVLGTNWKDEYHEITIKGQQAFQCALSIKIGDEWITRTDGAEASAIESVKGGYSNAFKRACVKFGIGRFLYDLPEVWLPLLQKGSVYVKDKKSNCSGYVNPPTLAELLSQQNTHVQQGSNQQQNRGNNHQQQSQNNQDPIKNLSAKQEAAINTIGQLISGLGIGENLANSMLKHMGSKAKNIRYATIKELEDLYHVLKPVHEFTMACRKANLDYNGIVWYAQIVLKTQITAFEQLFFSMNYELANQAIELVLADQSQRKQA